MFGRPARVLALALAGVGGAFALSTAPPLLEAEAQARTQVFGLAPRITVSPRVRVREVTNSLLGQGVWYSWQAYFMDTTGRRPDPLALGMFADLSPGIIGHYPGIGVITHDFQWKNVIGPFAARTDPTPRESTYDTPLGVRFGPDEYGAVVEEMRTRTGRPVDGSIQVNIVSGSAEDAADWVEYMNAPHDGSNPGGGTDWAARRAANGHPAPYNIRYWELGNEPHFTANNIGRLTAWDYVARIRQFVPLMKARDPSIMVMAYVNPFAVGDPGAIGSPAPDTPAGPAPDGSERDALTWTQAVIRHAGSLLDMLYFHWYGGWNQAVHSYEYSLTSMYTGLVPLLDRLRRDVDTYAPPEARERLRRVAIPEWNAYGGWFNPVGNGTAMLGALADSRVLHVVMRRPEVLFAERLALAAPFPDPPLNAGASADLVDVRLGYMAILGRGNGAELLGTAVYEVGRVWARALRPFSVQAEFAGLPTTAEGVSAVDVTALASADGRELNLVVTNGSSVELPITVVLQDYAPGQRATQLTVRGAGPQDANSWAARGRVAMREETVTISGPQFVLRVAPFSVTGVLLTP
jgi:alpha-N-arabinofuranosidase